MSLFKQRFSLCLAQIWCEQGSERLKGIKNRCYHEQYKPNLSKNQKTKRKIGLPCLKPLAYHQYTSTTSLLDWIHQ